MNDIKPYLMNEKDGFTAAFFIKLFSYVFSFVRFVRCISLTMSAFGWFERLFIYLQPMILINGFAISSGVLVKSVL